MSAPSTLFHHPALLPFVGLFWVVVGAAVISLPTWLSVAAMALVGRVDWQVAVLATPAAFALGIVIFLLYTLGDEIANG